MKSSFLMAIIISATSMVSGCASISQGTSQILTFNIEQKEARCILTRVDDGQIGTVSYSQNTATVSKDKDDIILQCKADGYRPYTSKIVSSASGAAVGGGLLLDLGIVDLSTGAFWKYPEQHNVSLEKEITGPSLIGEQPEKAFKAPDAAPAPSGTKSPTTTEEKLAVIKSLRDQSLISSAEYEDKRRSILAGL